MNTIPYGETLTYDAIATQVGSGSQAGLRRDSYSNLDTVSSRGQRRRQVNQHSGAVETVTKELLLDLENG